MSRGKPSIGETLAAGDMPAINARITPERVIDACERRMFTLDNPGFCIDCGEEQDGCEPDARGYRCEHCGMMAVYGADELAIWLM